MTHTSQAASPARRAPVARRARWCLVVAAVVTVAALQPAAAATPDWMRGAQEQLEPNNLTRPPGISVERCANVVRRETGGRVLSAAPVERSGEAGCEVRVLVDGKRVRSLFVDSRGNIRSSN